ncbi:MAG: hypothetical protein A2X49_11160 [Lentisphaerae bacterium GWF2_52_8]|nr:MAG: hypothetical protein A2X49_11160 [Lentisphaerae bacterium GWF2_52_8]
MKREARYGIKAQTSRMGEYLSFIVKGEFFLFQARKLRAGAVEQSPGKGGNWTSWLEEIFPTILPKPCVQSAEVLSGLRPFEAVRGGNGRLSLESIQRQLILEHEFIKTERRREGAHLSG